MEGCVQAHLAFQLSSVTDESQLCHMQATKSFADLCPPVLLVALHIISKYA